MFGFFKNLLRKSSAEAANTESAPAYDLAVSEPAAYEEAPEQPAQSRSLPAQQNGKGLELPLQSIINILPLELQPRVRMQRTGKMTITVPLEKVLAQLSRGAVKISFGELRQAVPEVFSSENDRDRVLISLPLSDILARLSPNLITRRRVQRQVQVPAEISSPFEGEGAGLAFSTSFTKSEPSPAPGAPRLPAAPIPPVAPKVPLRGTSTSVSTPPAPPALAMPGAQRLNLKSASTPPPPSIPRTPVAPAPNAPIPFQAPPQVPKAPQPGNGRSEAIPMPGGRIERKDPVPQDQTAFKTKPAAPKTPFRPAAVPSAMVPAAPPPPAVAPAPIPPTPEPSIVPVAAVPKHTTTSEPIMVAMTALADGWPDNIRKEIVDLKLVEAKIALPLTAAEQGLKQGRIAFSWKTIRSWIKPAVLPSVSAHDGTVLELPLKVVAPLFLARQKDSAKPQQKITVDEEIPNLFFGFPQPEGAVPAAQATARPADTNFYVWDDSTDMAKVHEAETKRGPTPGTKFVAKYATPNEVVSRAAGLDGVSGALIALPDGLMVANRLPPDLNADTLAAFLPQIFGKVSQCTKELRMGELNNLNFTVGNIPWKIFRVNSIFFAAFGRAGEPLPTAQLAALAAELDHNPR